MMKKYNRTTIKNYINGEEVENIDKLNYCCWFLKVLIYDPTVEILNDSMGNLNGIVKTLEGIRISLKTVDINSALNILKRYEHEMIKLINLGNMLRNGKKEVSSEFELALFNGMSPAPTNSIYFGMTGVLRTCVRCSLR